MTLKEYLKTHRPASLLIIRCYPVEPFRQLLREIREYSPDTVISLIVQKDFHGCFEVDREIVFTGKVFHLSNCRQMPIRALRTLKYDLLLVPCGNHDGAGYANVRWFSLAARAAQRISMFVDGRVERFNLGSLLLPKHFIKNTNDSFFAKAALPFRCIYYKTRYYIQYFRHVNKPHSKQRGSLV